MSAETYNKIRRILFSAANNPSKGFTVAYDWMESTYKKQLNRQSYIGLMAELNFYEKHSKEFCLTVAGDMGEHADFAGMYGSEPARFDVTTNINFKRFEDYEPFMGKGPNYKIALLDQQNFAIIDVLNLAFPQCEFCGGYLFPAVVLLNQNYNSRGESQWSNDQLLIDVCGGCEDIIQKGRYTHHGILSPQEYSDNIYDQYEDDKYEGMVSNYVASTYKYFRRMHSDYLMAVGSHGYNITERDGGGHWAIGFNFKNAAVADHLPQLIECSHEL